MRAAPGICSVGTSAFIYSFKFNADSVSQFDIFRWSQGLFFILLLSYLSPSLSAPSSHPLIARGVFAIIAVVLYTHLCVYVSDY